MADSHPSGFSETFEKLREQLACPQCEGELRFASQHASDSHPSGEDLPPGTPVAASQLVCARCGRGYPIVDGIPVLVRQ